MVNTSIVVHRYVFSILPKAKVVSLLSNFATFSINYVIRSGRSVTNNSNNSNDNLDLV